MEALNLLTTNQFLQNSSKMSPKIFINHQKIKFSIFLHVSRNSIRSEPCLNINHVWEYFHEYAQGGAPHHGQAQAIKESEEVGEADEDSNIFEIGEEAEEESRDSLKNRANVEAHLWAQLYTILSKHWTECGKYNTLDSWMSM